MQGKKKVEAETTSYSEEDSSGMLVHAAGYYFHFFVLMRHPLASVFQITMCKMRIQNQKVNMVALKNNCKKNKNNKKSAAVILETT